MLEFYVFFVNDKRSWYHDCNWEVHLVEVVDKCWFENLFKFLLYILSVMNETKWSTLWYLYILVRVVLDSY